MQRGLIFRMVFLKQGPAFPLLQNKGRSCLLCVRRPSAFALLGGHDHFRCHTATGKLIGFVELPANVEGRERWLGLVQCYR